ncbi:hypothetical protein, partial [Helcococcus bovis]|uniref:hypothetical protein n=1 Tax=Helcococcus bovis TaxID=3153252 RepID=UPI0038BBF4DA
MYDFYYFNKNVDSNNSHEVHSKNCIYLPDEHNRELIGFCVNCKEAIKKAKEKYPYKNFDGCYYCSTSC